MAPVELASISPTSTACQETFKTLCFLLQESPAKESEFGITLSESYNELARFNVWGSNIGAFQPAESALSLAQRLKNAPRIARQVSELLNDMEDTLQDVCTILSGERSNRTYQSPGQEATSLDEDSSSHGSETEEPVGGHAEDISEIRDLLALVSEITSNLFELSSKIRKETPRDRYLRAATALPELETQYAYWDKAHIHNKYPKLRPQLESEENWLANRLSRGITWRRQYLRYCQDHASQISTIRKDSKESSSKLVQQTPAGSQPESKVHRPAVDVLPPPSTTTLTTPSTFVEENVATNLDNREEQDIDEEVTPSVQATSVGTAEGETTAISPLKSLRKGNLEFLCPYCTQPQKFRKSSAWKEHALADLRPYICTFEDCELLMFPRRHDWFNHERQHHRVQWLCSFCAEGPYISENKFQNHLRAQHSDNFIDSQLPLLVNDGKRPMEHLPADCPFCDDFEKSIRLSNPQVSSNEILTVPWAVFRNHVGRHMKDLATFAIPRGEDEDDQDTIASGDSAKVAVAIADADLLQKELAPRKATTAGSQGSDVESNVTSETGMGGAKDVVIVPDAAENCFIGPDGLPQVGNSYSRLQDTDVRPVEQFLSWMERNLAYSVLGPENDNTERSFLPVDKVRQYFADLKKLNTLLKDLYYPDDPLVAPDIVLKDYILVLCTLISCGEGKRFPTFVELEMSNDNLRIEPNIELWSKIMTDETTGQISANKFFAHQWRFCSPIFDSSLLGDRYFTEHEILPIVRKEELELFQSRKANDAYDSVSYRIWLHNSYNKLIDDETKSHLSDDYRNSFRLDRRRLLDRGMYDQPQESTNIRVISELSKIPRILRCYGSFIQGRYRYTLFELEETTLEDFFEHTSAPIESQDIFDFWDNIFQLALALSNLYDLINTGTIYFDEYPVDLAPSNIFAVSEEEISPYKWRFKLNAPSRQHIKRSGVNFYNGPELSGVSHFEKAYTWPLGCLFFEAAVWVSGGYTNLVNYRAAAAQKSNLTFGGFLDTLMTYQEAAVVILHDSDTITERVLGLVREEMLVIDSAHRSTGNRIWRRCQDILSNRTLKATTVSGETRILTGLKDEDLQFGKKEKERESMAVEIPDRDPSKNADAYTELFKTGLPAESPVNTRETSDQSYLGELEDTSTSDQGEAVHPPPFAADLYDAEDSPAELRKLVTASGGGFTSMEVGSSPALDDISSEGEEEQIPPLSSGPSYDRIELVKPKSLLRRLFGRGEVAKEVPAGHSANPSKETPTPDPISESFVQPGEGYEYYQYLPLRDPTHIRLLTLCPGSFDDLIRTTLSIIDLKAGPRPYEALAYAWGDQHYTRQIFVDGRSHPITQSLYEALNYLRYVDKERVIWVDSVCINMADVEERSHQVIMMRDIYLSSASVLVWLGVQSDDSALAFENLEKNNFERLFTRLTSTGARAIPNLAEANWEVNIEHDALQAINNILQRPLFYRIWIWQEIQWASDESILTVGPSSIGLEQFRSALQLLVRDRVYDRSDIAGLRQRLVNVLAMVERVSDKSLRSLIHRTRHLNCTDPRDRIYALLGITDTPLSSPPDYSKTVLQVYMEATLQQIFELHDMTILSSCEMSNNTDWPTWVPDWSTGSEYLEHFTGLNAAGDTYPEVRRIDLNALEACGVFVDQIKNVFPLYSSHTITTLETLTTTRELLQQHGKKGTYIRGEPSLDVLCRTLCGNRVSKRYSPPREDFLDHSMISDVAKLFVENWETARSWYFNPLVNEFRTMAAGRSLFMTATGYLGLGPQEIQPGDTVCVLLGCNTPMILRPSDDVRGAFEVIGAAYVDGFSDGQAILGPLPQGTSLVYKYDETRKRCLVAYFDVYSGLTTTADPRLEHLPPEWSVKRYPEENSRGVYEFDPKLQEDSKAKATSRDPRLTPEALRKRGVKLQDFRLV